MDHDHPRRPVPGKLRHLPDEPALFIGRMAGILLGMNPPVILHDGPDTIGECPGTVPVGFLGRVAHRQVVDLFRDFVGVCLIRGCKLAPLLVYGNNGAGFIQDAQVYRHCFIRSLGKGLGLVDAFTGTCTLGRPIFQLGFRSHFPPPRRAAFRARGHISRGLRRFMRPPRGFSLFAWLDKTPRLLVG
jgi:hypothetical protein